MRTMLSAVVLAMLSLSAHAYEFDFTARLSGVSSGAVFSGHFLGNDPVNGYADLLPAPQNTEMDNDYIMSVDGMTYASGALGFNLTTKPGNTGVIHGLSLSNSIDVSAFDGHSSLAYGFMQRRTGCILGFEVLSVSVVPEPSSFA